MDDSNTRFVLRAIRRKRLFLTLSIVGATIAAGLAGWYGWRRFIEPDYPIGPRAVILVLILLNARQNLRQYRYAVALERLMERDDGSL
jgi:hypothetical protein